MEAKVKAALEFIMQHEGRGLDGSFGCSTCHEVAKAALNNKVSICRDCSGSGRRLYDSLRLTQPCDSCDGKGIKYA